VVHGAAFESFLKGPVVAASAAPAVLAHGDAAVFIGRRCTAGDLRLGPSDARMNDEVVSTPKPELGDGVHAESVVLKLGVAARLFFHAYSRSPISFPSVFQM
jgi:hypothetical protein